MTCPSCGFDNRDEARFCGECGGALSAELRCRGCGHVSPAGRRFCDECGRPLGGAPVDAPQAYTPRHLAEKILTARSALEGERKQVTVLFADVKGSMELAEQVDAEEWHRILDRFFQILTEGVHRYEGTINQYTGDGIMALFGAPIAHEDHAQRACFAALDLRDALRRYADDLRVSDGLNFSVRMGLNSGDVVVGKIGDDLRMDYTAQGLTVGLAARMESLAEPGNILMTQHTADLVAGYFRLRDLGPSRVRGVSQPLRLYELEGVGELRTRFDVSRARGFSRFVGRAAEMREMEGALERALAGDASVVGVTAEAGTGKSRLCHEFAQSCRARGIAVYEGHALSHGKMVPLLPLIELLRGLFGVGSGDDAATARQKIAGTIVLLDAGLQESLPLWFDFLGVSDAAHVEPALAPEARQARLMAATRSLIQARGRSGPDVLVLEDLHWLDAASEALLASLAEGLAGSRTLLLVNFRPEYQSAWKQREQVPYREIRLRPLGDDDIEALLDDLLGGDPQLAPLRRRVHETAGGSPFFVEEVVRSLFDHGVLSRRADGSGAVLARHVDQVEIPATVQAVLAARVDRLPEAPKLVLQTAAVIGKSFPEQVLRSALDEEERPVPLAPALADLEAAGFLRREAVHPESRWAFLHPLTQEVAYASQLSDRRVRVHAAVARAVEAAYATRLDEHAGLLAHHWAGAGESVRSAAWHARAAEWLGARDRREMMRHWHQVRDLLARAPESPEAFALGVVARQRLLVNGVFVGMSTREVDRLFHEGIDLAERLPDLSPQVLLRISYGLTRLFSGAVGDSLEQMREVLRLAEESEQPMLRYVAHVSMLAPLINSGHLLEAVARAEKAEMLSGGDVTLAADFARFSPFGALLANRAQALIYLGRFDDVLPTLERVLEIGRVRNDPELILMARIFQAELYEILGDRDNTMRYARQAVDVAEGSDSPQLRAGAYGVLGMAHYLAGDWGKAIEAWSLVLTVMHDTGTGLFLEAPRLVDRAEARLQLGDTAEARRDLERAIAIGRERSAALGLARALPAYAWLLRLEGNAAGAEAALLEAEELIARISARAYEPDVHLERAELAASRHDPAARRRSLAAARAILAEMGAVARVAAVDAMLSESPRARVQGGPM